MYLIQILLPINDNNGKPFEGRMFTKVKMELTGTFGGITAYTRSPAEGIWKEDSDEDRTYRDDVIVYEVSAPALDRKWWSAFREKLELDFRQESIFIRGWETFKL